MDYTQIEIENGTDDDVVVWVTLGATDGCLHDVTQIPYVKNGAGLVGSFTLKAGDTTPLYAPHNLGFNGNLSFDTQPMNCPTPDCPNGVSIFEFIINNGFQSGTPQETIDISCVAGVNCLLSCGLVDGSPWNGGSSYVGEVHSIKNNALYHNDGMVGVFPYGCDDCTESVAPPECEGHPPYANPQAEPICLVQRDAVGSNGGYLHVTYLGVA